MTQQLCPLYKQAINCPNQIALIEEGRSWSYQELNGKVNTLYLYLKKLGVQKTERVAFIATTSLNTVLLFCALFRLKAIACPLSWRIPQEQIQAHLKRLKYSHFIDPDQFPLDNLTLSDPFLSLHRADFKDSSPHRSSSIELIDCDPAVIDLNALSTFLFTSGSSGISKIACHNFGNHYYNALGTLEALQLNKSSRYLLSLPLFHISGISILFRIWLCGGTLVLSSLSPLEAIKQHSITHLSLVPTQLYRLLQNIEKSPPPPSLRCLLLGGAPVTEQLLKLALELKWPVRSTYGMTETSSMMTLGKVLPFREIQIRDQEIYVRGRTLFQGYWDSEQEKIIDPTQGGWLATRDLGHFNAQGDLEILGRKDRQFISGGENIQPEEIERALCTLPGILAAHVIGIDDPEFGKRPIAYIEDITKTHTLITIREGLKTLLPGFKHPIQLLPLSSINSVIPKI